MGVTKTSTNYAGRKRDILIFQNVKGDVVGNQKATVGFSKNSKQVAGVQKLVQRYTISLLTVLGSQEDYPDFGSAFLSKAYAGVGTRDKTEMTHQFNFANMKVLSKMRAYQATRTDIPTDEAIASSKLLSLEYLPSILNFSVGITTLSGDSLDFIVPLPLDK